MVIIPQKTEGVRELADLQKQLSEYDFGEDEQGRQYSVSEDADSDGSTRYSADDDLGESGRCVLVFKEVSFRHFFDGKGSRRAR